ncbi:hypothetical protein HWD32_gp27 [Gordonia phage Secretariat]|uniref:Uncharacterized protein n=1 Tax=Gordonia phage Secretariat TaxID=2725616 RepID=A0A6M3SUJ1_9CAUD|nr:hypothetical protein HWD32_gp27 [Gordonia phage Secretariat]QJD49605.1 hypothetical protein SEA_SECRETARIAT_27 [Gordonia phage Secretariat]
MIKVGGVTPNRVRLGSATPKVVVANHPVHGIREVYPIGTYVTRETSFDTPQDLGQFPISYMSESNMVGGTVVSGNYTPRLTSVAAKQYRLLDQQFNGNEMTVEFVPSLISPLTRPSSVVLGANIYADYAVEFVFGNDGSRLEFTDYDGTHVLYSHAHTINNGSTIRIKRLRDVVVVYVNGVYVYSAKHPDLEVGEWNAYPGFSTTSSSTTISTSFASIKFVGSTSEPASVVAHFDMERIQAPSGTLGDAGKFYIAQGGPILITFNEFRWTTTTSFSQREGHVVVNGVRQIFIGGQNGGDGYKEMTIPPNSLFEITTWCSAASANDRWVKSGYIDVYQ